MKTTLTPAPYETPNTEVFTLEIEGALLQDSYLEGVDHNGFTKGDDIWV